MVRSQSGVVRAHSAAAEKVRCRTVVQAAGIRRKRVIVRKGRTVRAGDAAASETGAVEHASTEMMSRTGSAAQTSTRMVRA